MNALVELEEGLRAESKFLFHLAIVFFAFGDVITTLLGWSRGVPEMNGFLMHSYTPAGILLFLVLKLLVIFSVPFRYWNKPAREVGVLGLLAGAGVAITAWNFWAIISWR